MKNKVKKFRSPDPGGLTRDTITVGEAFERWSNIVNKDLHTQVAQSNNHINLLGSVLCDVDLIDGEQ